MELGTAFGLGESLLLTALGGIIATSATLLATRMQAKEAARMRAEQFDRDDKFRLHKERVEVYVHFRVEVGHARDVLLDFAEQPAAPAARARGTPDP